MYAQMEVSLLHAHNIPICTSYRVDPGIKDQRVQGPAWYMFLILVLYSHLRFIMISYTFS